MFYCSILMTTTTIAQALGMLSFALGILCFYQKSDRRLKIVMVSLHLNNVLHFYLLGAPTASLGAALSLVRTGIALHTSSRWAAVFFIALTLVMGIVIADSISGIFPILGSCIGTYATFCLRAIRMRIAFLCGALCWLANNSLVGSIGGVMLEIVLIAVNLNTIRRLWIDRRYAADNDKLNLS